MMVELNCENETVGENFVLMCRYCSELNLKGLDCLNSVNDYIVANLPALNNDGLLPINAMNSSNSTATILEGAARFENNEIFQKYSQNRSLDDPARSILLAVYATLVVVGAFGNVLVVLSLIRKPSMRTARNMFILNLAVSDSFVCLVATPLSLTEILTIHWPLPRWQFLCKVTGTIQAVSIFVSTITITAIALDRYQLIVYPTRASIQTMSAILVMFIIWLISFALASPFAVYREITTFNVGYKIGIISFCGEHWPTEKGAFIYSVAILIFQFLLPASVVVIAHTKIHRRLRGRRRNRRRTPAILIAIAVTYVISWLPLNVFNVITDFKKDNINLDRSSYVIVNAICHMFGMSSACTNPLLYGWLNDNFRKEFKEMLCCSKGGRTNTSITNGKKRPADTELTVLNNYEKNSENKTSQVTQAF